MVKKKKIISHSALETRKIAAQLAKRAKGGEVYALIGDLGAGKTTFVKAFARALGVRETVSSPTFVLMRMYKLNTQRSTPNTLIHIDAYRLKDARELEDIGATEYIGDDQTVTLIEWAEKVKNILPKKKTKTIRLKYGKKECERVFVIA